MRASHLPKLSPVVAPTRSVQGLTIKTERQRQIRHSIKYTETAINNLVGKFLSVNDSVLVVLLLEDSLKPSEAELAVLGTWYDTISIRLPDELQSPILNQSQKEQIGCRIRAFCQASAGVFC